MSAPAAKKAARKDQTKRMIKSVSKMTEKQKIWFLGVLEEVSKLKTQEQMIAYLENKTPNPDLFRANLRGA